MDNSLQDNSTDATPNITPTPASTPDALANIASSSPVNLRPATTSAVNSGVSMDGVVRRTVGTTSRPRPVNGVPSVNNVTSTFDSSSAPQPATNGTTISLNELDGTVDSQPVEPPTVATEVASVTPVPEPVNIESMPSSSAPVVNDSTITGFPSQNRSNLAANSTRPTESANKSPLPIIPDIAPVPKDEESPKHEGSVMAPVVKSAPKSHKGSKVAIMVGILFALALIGGAGYAYWQNNKSNSNTPVAEQTQQAAEDDNKTKPATAKDVQKAIDDIDTNLGKVDDSKDFVESDLSNSALGL
ncbi:hypothetical protein KDA11_05265 [Candidatus Saccharibacteria bacterium]|nr:hypothetical protein [Candidatus Saccharibacteria bacterium]